jgi:hypothetical protein
MLGALDLKGRGFRLVHLAAVGLEEIAHILPVRRLL